MRFPIKKHMKKLSRLYSITLILTLSLSHHLAFSQNKVGLGVANPEARLHIKGVDNISQLCIDADTQQTNLYPLIR